MFRRILLLIFGNDTRTRDLILTIGTLAGFVIASWFLMLLGGSDLYDCYRPFMYGDYTCVFVPPHASTMLLPLLLPWPWAWPTWTIINGVLIIILFRKMRQNPLPVLFSFPWIIQWWLGQIDIIPVMGIFILLFSQAYYLKFLGAWMGLTKIHLLALPAVMYAVDRRKNWIAIAAAMLVSCVFFGFWPPLWLSRLTNVPFDLWRVAPIYLAPLGFIIIILFRRNIYIILAAILLLPPSSIYTYFYLWALPGVRGWLLTLLSWIWVLLFPIIGKNAAILNSILPLVAIYFIYQQTEKPNKSEIAQLER